MYFVRRTFEPCRCAFTPGMDAQRLSVHGMDLGEICPVPFWDGNGPGDQPARPTFEQMLRKRGLFAQVTAVGCIKLPGRNMHAGKNIFSFPSGDTLKTAGHPEVETTYRCLYNAHAGSGQGHPRRAARGYARRPSILNGPSARRTAFGCSVGFGLRQMHSGYRGH